jgi:hypothetical protein
MNPNPMAIGIVVYAFTFGGSLAGLKLRAILPEDHLSTESKDTVKVGIGLIATMTALILGLVTASAKASFDVMDTTIKQAAADTLSLDRMLARYGPETAETRAELKRFMAQRIDTMWSPAGSPAGSREGRLASTSAGRGAEELAGRIGALVPQTEEQRRLQSRALNLGESLLAARWSVAAFRTSLPTSFLVILVFWLTITFTSFGLFAPKNSTVVSVLFVCALSVAGAVFLVLELDGPLDGLIMVSPEPFKYAVAHLNE